MARDHRITPTGWALGGLCYSLALFVCGMVVATATWPGILIGAAVGVAAAFIVSVVFGAFEETLLRIGDGEGD